MIGILEGEWVNILTNENVPIEQSNSCLTCYHQNLLSHPFKEIWNNMQQNKLFSISKEASSKVFEAAKTRLWIGVSRKGSLLFSFPWRKKTRDFCSSHLRDPDGTPYFKINIKHWCQVRYFTYNVNVFLAR